MPTVSAVDPGGNAVREGLGECAEDLDAMERAVRRWIEDPARRAAAGARARAYTATHRAPDVVLDRLAAVLDGLVKDVRAARARGLAPRGAGAIRE